MSRRAAVIVAFAALALPAQATAASDAVSPRQVVRSGDGLLTLTIPPGAVTKPVRIKIRTLKPSVLAGELRKVAAPGPVYELLPDGLRFAKPITITRRVKDLDLRKGVPLLAPASRQGKGRWTMLGNPRVERRGGVVTVSGTTRHFSQVAAFKGAATATLTPAKVKLTVGARFKANLRLSGPPGDYVFQRHVWTGSGSIRVVANRRRGLELEADLECATPGTGTYRAHVEVEDETAGTLFVKGLALGGVDNYVELYLSGTAECGGAEVPRLDVALGWNHPPGSSTSLICIGITATSGATVKIEASGPGGYAASGTLTLKKKETATAPGTFTFVIGQLGRYTLRITATAGGTSVTKTRILDVTEARGTGTCTR